ncbi:MAG: MG2 domain-containing protein [Treponema sp.]|nr:MG2 domain-containing protein [Treponema sp.]
MKSILNKWNILWTCLCILLLGGLVLSCKSDDVVERPVDENGLFVMDFQPAGELPAAVKYPAIYVQFSKPVVPVAKLGEPSDKSDLMKIEPPLKGVFRWYGTSLLSFDAEEAVIPQREYKVTLSDSISSVDGSPISGQLVYTFRTEPLKLESITPGYKASLEGLWLNRNDLPVEAARSVALYFSYPVETKEIAKHLNIVDGTGKSYKFDISHPDKKNKNLVELFLKETPPDNTSITVVVQAGARSDSKSIGTVEEDRSHRYHTLRPFELESVYYDRSSSGSQSHPVSLQFSHQLDEKQDIAAIAQAITAIKLVDEAGSEVNLPMAVTAENISIMGNQLRVHSLPVTYEESYRVAVAAGVVRDVYGRVYEKAIGPEIITVPAAASFARFKNYGFSMLEASFPPQLAFAYQNLLPKSSYVVEALSGGQWKQVQKVEFEPADMPKNQQLVEAVDLSSALKDGFGAARFTADMEYQWTNWWGETKVSSEKNQQVIQVTDLGLTVRYGFNRAVVLVSQLSTGKPVAGARVSLYAKEKYLDARDILTSLGNAQGSGTTDKDGLVVLHIDEKLLNENVSQVFISAEKDADKAVFAPSDNELWQYGYTSSPASIQDAQMVTFMFSDRGLYKPGEKVTVRGIDRNLTLGEYDAYAGKATITLKQAHWRAEPIETQELEVSPSGGFWATFQLKEELAPGSYQLVYERRLPNGSTDSEALEFTVAYFERLRFESSVAMAEGTFISGDRLSAELSASYLGGGSLAGSSWRSDWYREPTYFMAEGKELQDYIFGPREGDGRRRMLTSEQGQLDSSGLASTAQFSGEEAVQGKPYLYQVETTVTDSGGQAISATGKMVVHPASFYIGVSQPKEVKGFPKKNEPLTFEFALVTPESQLADEALFPKDSKEAVISVELLRESWIQVREMNGRGQIVSRYTEELVTEYTGTVKLEQTGTVTVRPPKGGVYLLRLTSQDSRGRVVVTERSFYVSGSDWSYYHGESQQINMIPDKELYQVEDTAQIMVQSPLPKGQYLVTIEREGIFSQEVISLQEPTTVLDIPISDRYLPVVYVTLSSYSVRENEPSHDFTSQDQEKPKGYFGATALHVSPKVREFNVEIQLDKTLYQPGEEATVTLKATSQDGQPLAGAELSFMAVDRGVIDLIGYHVPDPLAHFYNERLFLSGVRGGDSRSLLIDPVTYETENIFGGEEALEKSTLIQESAEMDMMRAMNTAAAGAGPQVRSNFDPTAVFAPALVTGADGTITHSFTLPDSLTEYRLTAVGMLGTTHFALEEGELSVNNPVSVRDVLPRRLREDDVSDLGVVVSNLDGQAHQVSVTMELISGLEAAGLPAEVGGIRRQEGEARAIGSTTRTVSVPAERTVPILFEMEALQEGFVSVVFTVDSAVVQEKIVKPLEIDRPYIYETVTTVGEVSADTADGAASLQEAIILPLGMEDERSGGLQVVLDPTRLGTLTEAITYVFRYPYGCLEQRSSAMLPLVYFGDYIDVFGLKSEVEDPFKVVESEIADWATLQKADGGFPYWRSSSYSSLPATLRIAELLAAARDHKITIPKEINLEKLASYITKEAASSWYKHNSYVQAYSLFVLDKLTGSVSTAQVDQVMALSGLGFAEKALCGIVYLHNGASDKALEIAADVRRHSRPTVRGMDITDGASAGWMYFSGESEMNALLLQFFTQLNAADDMNGRLLFNLLEIQRAGNGYWKNTASTARVLEAVACYIEANNLESLNLEGIFSIEGKTLATGSFQGLGAKPVENSLSFGVLAEAGLEAGKTLPMEFSKTGTGTLFYSLSMKYALPVEEQLARDEGLSVYVEISELDSGKVVKNKALQAGTIYKAQVTLSSTKNRTFVALRVPIPSGAEVLNADFATMPQLAGTASKDESASTEDTLDEWGNWFAPGYNFGLSSREIYDNEVRYFWDAFRRGRQQVEFLFHPVRSGSFTVPSATAECMYEPEIFGRTQGAMVEIQ